jgi:hypothetical protein
MTRKMAVLVILLALLVFFATWHVGPALWGYHIGVDFRHPLMCPDGTSTNTYVNDHLGWNAWYGWRCYAGS